MFCNKCGSQIPDGINFCNKCGAPVALQTPVAPQGPAPEAPQMPEAPQPQPSFVPYDAPAPRQIADDDQATIIPPPLFDDTLDPGFGPASDPGFGPAGDPGFGPATNPGFDTGFGPDFPPEPTDDGKKKKKKTTIIIVAVAALVVAIAVVCILIFVVPGNTLTAEDESGQKMTSASTVSTLPEKPSGNSTKPSSPSEPSTAPSTPTVDLKGAEKLADDVCDKMYTLEMKDIFEKEILGWAYTEELIDNYVMEQTGTDNKADGYQKISGAFSSKVTNAEEFLNALFSSVGDYDAMLASKYGDDYTTSADHTVTEITADEAAPFVEKTKKKVDSFSSFGLNSKNLDWDKIDSFVQVKTKKTISGSLETETNDVLMILGCIDGKWTIVYVDDSGDPSMCLYSLSFLEEMLG